MKRTWVGSAILLRTSNERFKRKRSTLSKVRLTARHVRIGIPVGNGNHWSIRNAFPFTSHRPKGSHADRTSPQRRVPLPAGQGRKAPLSLDRSAHLRRRGDRQLVPDTQGERPTTMA